MARFKQAERLIKILQKLSLNRVITVNQLYEYFQRGVPKRTLQRDLIELSSASIPIYDSPGNGQEKVWHLDPSYKQFVPETMGSKELLASFFLERLSAITKGTKLESDIKSLLRKSKQLVPSDVFQSIDNLDQSKQLFGATFTGYIDYSSHSQSIDTLISATSSSMRCQFKYKKTWTDQISTFEADPYLILYHKGALYAIVYVEKHDNYIFLPVQRIKVVQPTGASFVRDKAFSLEKLRKNRFGIYGHEDMKPEKIVLKFHKEIADVVAERIWHSTQKLTRQKNGTLRLEMSVIVSDELMSWIAGWQNYVTVISPKTLRTQFGKIATTLKKEYK